MYALKAGELMSAKKQAAPILSPFLLKLERSSPLSSEDRAALLQLPCRMRLLRARTTIPTDTHGFEVSVLVEGMAARAKHLRGGARQILALHIAGDLIDPQSVLLPVADHEITAISSCLIAFIPRAVFLRLMEERPALFRAIMIDALIDASITREWMVNIGRRSAYSRTAHLLCEIAWRLKAAGQGNFDRFELLASQCDLADALGITSVHVNRTLQLLRADRLIATEKRTVNILDRARLIDAAEFDPNYLHLERSDDAEAGVR